MAGTFTVNGNISYTEFLGNILNNEYVEKRIKISLKIKYRY
jgi:hypothetical protein